MNPLFRRALLTLLLATFAAAFATGCQTTNGLGKDVEKLGENIQKGSK